MTRRTQPPGLDGMLTVAGGITGMRGLNPSSGFPCLHLFAAPNTPAQTAGARAFMAHYLRAPEMLIGSVNRHPDLNRVPFAVELVGAEQIALILEDNRFERLALPGWVEYARQARACCIEVIGRPWPWPYDTRHDPRYTDHFLNDPSTQPRAAVVIPIPRPRP